MCDIQILTGLGVLLSGFIGLNCYVSAYHWQLSIYLAWFSNITHTASLSSLRTYLYRNQTERNYRTGLMLLLLVRLIAALGTLPNVKGRQPTLHQTLDASSLGLPLRQHGLIIAHAFLQRFSLRLFQT